MTEDTLFLLLTFSIGLVTLGGVLFAYRRSRDSFHPLIYLGLILFFPYCYIPWELYSSHLADLNFFLSTEQRTLVQAINLLGIVSLLAGVLSGDGKIDRQNRQNRYQQIWRLPLKACKRFDRAAILFGVLGVAAYLYGIANVGGFAAAYGHSYGGGWSGTGYAREALQWTLPALLWFMTTHVERKLTRPDWVWIGLFAFPLLTQGLLGARRGPTAMVVVVVFMGWYLIRRRRPTLKNLIAGSVALGMLLLFLLANRGEIYLGSDFDLKWSVGETYTTNVTSGNEFVYGSGVILNAQQNNDYYWGGRYITSLFIRPIPRQLWPTQYADAARWFGIPNIAQTNAGTVGETWTLEWTPPKGAAPGMIADLWVEFWWYYLIALYLLGWFYGMAWRKAVTRGKLWIPVYTIAAALSIYFMQTFEAFAFRFMFMGFAIWVIWLYGKRALGSKNTLTQQTYFPPSNHQPHP